MKTTELALPLVLPGVTENQAGVDLIGVHAAEAVGAGRGLGRGPPVLSSTYWEGRGSGEGWEEPTYL